MATPLTTFRTWIAERALGMPLGALSLSRKSNPVGGLIASMWSQGSPVYTPISFEALAREGFQRNGYIFRSISIIGQAAAGIPWVLYRDKGAGGSTTRRLRGGKINTTEVDSHPLLDLLARPHQTDDIMGTASLIEAFVSFRTLAGNSYLYAARPTTRTAPPQELWVLRPDRVRIIPAADGSVQSYRYTVGGKYQDFDPASVLHWKTWHPTDDYYGLSPVAVAARVVDQMNAANDWNTALMQNLARPGGFLSTSANLTDPQFTRLKDELKDQYANTRNAGRPHLLEGGLTWQQVGLTPVDMDWLKGKTANVREIAVMLGVPAELLGDSTNKTYSNYQEARKAFYMETVLPLLDGLRDLLNAWLVPMYGDAQLRLDYDRDDIEALQEDRVLVWSRAQAAYDTGLLSQNEARDLLGYEATKDGDVFLAPPRAMTLDQLLAGLALPGGASTPKNPGTPPTLALPPAPPDPHDAPTPQPPTGVAGEKARRLPRRIRRAARKARTASDPSQQRDQWAAQLTTEAIAQFQRERRQLAAILADTSLGDTHARAKAATAAVASFAPDWHNLLLASYAAIGIAAGNALYAQFESAGYIPSSARYTGYASAQTDALDSQLTDSADDMTDYSRERVGAVLTDAASAGTTSSLTDALNQLYSEWTGSDGTLGRADVIGMTEAQTAWHMGADDAADAAEGAYGIAVERTWNAVEDAHTRPEHADADGQTATLDESFDVGGEQLSYPGDPSGSPENTIECRCYLTYDVTSGASA